MLEAVGENKTLLHMSRGAYLNHLILSSNVKSLQVFSFKEITSSNHIFSIKSEIV